MNSYPNMG